MIRIARSWETKADGVALEAAIDDYKAALVPETTALP